MVKLFSAKLMGKNWSAVPPKDLDSQSTFVFVSATPKSLDPDSLVTLANAFPNSTVVGCSSAGSFLDSEIFDEGLTVGVCRFQTSKLDVSTYDFESNSDFFSVGEAIGQSAIAIQGLKHILILADGLNINATQIVSGLISVIEANKSGASVSGGLASDGLEFRETWTLLGRSVQSKRIIVVCFSGEHLTITNSADSGWDRIGPARKITKAKDNVLFEIDGRPALDVYESFLGDEIAKGLPGVALQFPLSIASAGRPDTIRTIIGLDRSGKTMTFAGEMPEGSDVFIMKAGLEKLLLAAEAVGQHALVGQGARNPLFGLGISCVGRRSVLGERTDFEIDRIFNQLPERSILVGFYSNGEINRLPGAKYNLLNQTFSLTLFGEG